ncbi:MAG: alpha/beta hydrolase [Clostridiales bacterium]|nr:alpha/beta hydrolase [Clostridiales bacterium]
MIEKDQHYLSSDRKTKIHFHEWLPEGFPKAVVQVSHGITEHIGRYGKLANALVEKGYAVAGNDHLGHGKSEKPECYRWEYLVKDTRRLQEYLKQQYPTVPFYNIGFSLGPFVVRDLLARYPAAILIGTGFQSSTQISFAKAIAGVEAKRVGDWNQSKFIQSLSFGAYNRYFRPNKTEFDWLCESTDVVIVEKTEEEELTGRVESINDDGSLVISVGDWEEDTSDESIGTLTLSGEEVEAAFADDISAVSLINLKTIMVVEAEAEEDTDAAEDSGTEEEAFFYGNQIILYIQTKIRREYRFIKRNRSIYAFFQTQHFRLLYP